MAHVYEKMTKETVDLSAYVLCFLGVIMSKLEFYGFIDGKPSHVDTGAPNKLIIPIVSKKFKYCYDGIELITKTLKRRGFNCKMSRYKTAENKGETEYSYEYEITKMLEKIQETYSKYQ